MTRRLAAASLLTTAQTAPATRVLHPAIVE